jgi:hypothetical protein
VEIWKGMAGYGEHLATFYPDLAAEDPCVLPPVEEWTK